MHLNQVRMGYPVKGIARYMIGDKDGALADWLKTSELGDPDVNEMIEKYS